MKDMTHSLAVIAALGAISAHAHAETVSQCMADMPHGSMYGGVYTPPPSEGVDYWIAEHHTTKAHPCAEATPDPVVDPMRAMLFNR